MYKVCVADDCADEVEILCEGLRLNNYESVAAYTGEQALQVCEAGGIDLLLLDIGLPGIDGYEVCTRIKNNPQTKDIAVIFVSGRGDAGDVRKGYDLGAVDYITKPYNLPIVMVRVDSAMRTRQSTTATDYHADHLLDSVYTDHLTGLRNRRFLLERLQEEVEKAHRYDYPVSIIVLDIDEVKGLDSDFGAAPMDDLLAEIAMAMRNSSRRYDVLARYDGALFAAVLPHAMLKDAVSYANKIQDEITSTTFSEPCFPTQAKMSFGIVTCRNGQANGAERILGKAMRNLLQASTRAGNRIVGHDLNES